jgi:hypothetical protein
MAREIKIPKRIAGIKIPKSIRKGPIADFVNSSGGQVLIAEAVLALGGLYAARRFDANTPTGELLRHPIEGLRTKLAGTGFADGALSSASDRFGRACRAGLAAFRAELAAPGSNAGMTAEPVAADPTAVSPETEAEVPKKKSPRSRAEPRRETTSGPH